jgi:hypothetical protein
VSLSVPSPFAVVPEKPKQARAFAEQLARALGVRVTESSEPGTAPGCGGI